MNKVFVVSARRTPIAKANPDHGDFRNIRADELLSKLLEYFSQNIINPNLVDDIYIGCVGQHLEQGKNIARLAALLAKYPFQIPGATFNRLCGSSLQAFTSAASAIQSNHAEIILAGGVEHMHHVPMQAAIDCHKSFETLFDFPFYNMGLTAEKVASKHKISRDEQDKFSLQSHQKAIHARENGFLEHEIISVSNTVHDQGPRANSTIQSLNNLKPIFKENGSVTAGNSSPISVGASLCLLASEHSCKKNNLTPKAQFIDSAVVGLDPTMMGMGPVPAIQKLLSRNNLSLSDIDFFEINEAFASQALACILELKIPPDKVNCHGGAIAIGHPLGCTGTRLIGSLMNVMERNNGKLGIATMCIGHGQGMATLIRKL